MAIKIGCCGFPVARRRYCEQFSRVEIQQSFYQFPTLEPTSPTYRRLGRGIPEDTGKNYGSFKPTDEVFETFEATEQFCLELKAKSWRGKTSYFMFNNISMLEDAH
jgi:uncharacterized protein YecE (DUF72 family)